MTSNVSVQPAKLPLLSTDQPYLPAVYRELEAAGRSPVAAAGPRSAWIEVVQHAERQTRKALGLIEFASLAGQLAGVERVVLTGRGDPLQNEEVGEMAGLLKLRISQVLLDVHGAGLNRAAHAELWRSSPDEIRVLLPNSRPAAGAGERQSAGLARLHDVLGAWRDAQPGGPRRLVLRCQAQRDCLDDLPAAVRLAAEVGAAEVYLARFVFPLNRASIVADQALFGQPLSSVDEILSECEALSVELGVPLRAAGGRDPRHSLAAAAEPAAAPWRACLRPWTGIYVAVGGDCYPCRIAPEAWPVEDGAVMGNLQRESLAAIWNGPRYQAFRQALLTATPPAACRGCGVKWSL